MSSSSLPPDRDYVAPAWTHHLEFDELVRSILDYAIFLLDRDGRVITWNDGAQRFKGYAADEIIGRSYTLFYPPNDVATGKPQRLLETAAREGRVEDEGWRIRKDGRSFWADVVITAVRDASGELLGFLKVTRDLTERREAETRRAFLAAVFDNLPGGIALLDRDLVFQAVNPTFATVFGRAPDAFVHKHVRDAFPGAGSEYGAILAKVLASGEPYAAYGLRIAAAAAPAGEEAYWDFTYAPIRDERGAVTGVMALCFDVTPRVRLEQQQITQLHEIDRLKDEFLSVISHELRTPLNFITGFASTLDDEVQGPLNPAQHEALGKILNGADRMLKLVDDLLDFAKIQSGHLDLGREAVPYAAVVAEVLGLLKPLGERKGLEIASEVPPDLVAWLDPDRVSQVLTNLVGNAIKFTPPGGRVVVRAAARGASLLTEVVDTGQGIGPEHREKLFRRFQQVDMSNTRQASGTGLGLAISKGLVEAHGGEIGVESTLGEGSTFWFRLPLAPEA